MDKQQLTNKVLYVTSQFTKGVETQDSLESITIEGYANCNTVDRQGDVIPSTVWDAGMDNYIRNPIMLAYHDHSQPIGRMVEHKVDSKGLWIKASISSAAEDVYNLVKAGVLTAFSVGFRVLDASYDSTLDLFIIKELELLEISVVSVPANQDSLFSLAKSFDNATDLEVFKKQYASKDTLDNSQDPKEVIKPSSTINKGILQMDPKDLEAMLTKAASDAVTQAEERRIQAEKSAKAASEP